MTDSATSGGTAELTTADAVREVEEQMHVLAGFVRTSVRDAALSVDPALRPLGLKLLRTLARNGPTHASALADLLLVDRSVISREARQLELLGLIELQIDPQDGRARYLALTPKAARKPAVTEKLPIFTRLNAWPTEDIHLFATLLERLNNPPE
ncbi:MAG TPA: MarR family transcriptional regulator [Glaciibacter sp.]|nr:MarR family transcriptional regulator [Glaciibacter sp.]